MPISYLSRILTPQEHVAPVDESLVFKALLYKQQQFDQGVQMVQSQLDQLGSQDIIHPEHKQYFNEKMQNLTNEVNKMGGADFSKRDTLFKVKGLTSAITGDERIQGAISDTRRVRDGWKQLQAWKNDPKKYAGMYHPANEADFFDAVNKYTKTPGAQASFNYEPMPFQDFDKELQKEMKQISDRVIKTGNYDITMNGYNKRITKLDPSEIEQVARYRLASDPRWSRQIQMNANYFGKAYQQDPVTFKAQRMDLYARRKQSLTDQLADKEIEWKNQLATKQLSKDDVTLYRRQYNDQIARYDEQIARVATDPLDKQIQDTYLESYIGGLQSQYAFNTSKLTTDVAYWKNKELGMRVAEMQQDESQFVRKLNMDQQKMQMEYSFKQQELAAQIEKNTGLSSGSGKAEQIGFSPIELPNEPGSIHTPTLESINTDIQNETAQQSKQVTDTMIDIIRSTNRDLAAKLSNRIAVHYNPDGTIKDAKFPTVGEGSLRMVNEFITNYNRVLKGEQVGEYYAKMLGEDGSTLRTAFNKTTQGAKVLQLHKEQLKKATTAVDARVKFTPEERLFMQNVERQRTQNPAVFDTMGPVGNSVLSRYYDLKGRYNQYKSVVEEELSKQGIASRGYEVSGAALKPGSSLYQLVTERIASEAARNGGEDNAQFRKLQEQLNSGTLDIEGVTIDPNSNRVRIRGTVGTGDSKAPITPTWIDFGNTVNWNSVLPQQLGGMRSNNNLMLQNHLDTKGHMIIGGDRLTYSTTRGLPIGFSVEKTNSGRYELIYQNGTDWKKVPDAAISGNFAISPLEWMDGSLDNWYQSVVEPAMRKRYGMDAQGKPIPGYKPTLQQFDQMMQELKQNY